MGRVEVFYVLTSWMRFPIAYVWIWRCLLLVHGRYERVIFAFQGTVQKSIVQGMRVNCTRIYSIELYSIFLLCAGLCVEEYQI